MSEMIDRVANALLCSTIAGTFGTEDEVTMVARAVIEAMREPTGEMIVYGADGGGGEPITSWRRMIDAALGKAEG